MKQNLITETEKSFAIALLTLDGMGPARIERMRSAGSFEKAWHCISSESSGKIAEMAKVGQKTAQSWKTQSRQTDPEKLYQDHKSVETVFFDEPGYPRQLTEDMEPPPMLFAKGSVSLAELFEGRRTVGIVGTRNCTRYGADIAYELGRELSLAGVVVVSGLAIGIDNAAHFGSTSTLEAAPSAAVVGSGLDIIYPKRSEKIFSKVEKAGAIISEAPLGSPPKKWRFPSRNRIIAGLSEVIIVVESHGKGGALITAEEAGVRGKVVMAVPGSIRSPASTGTNRLIAEGCQLVTDIADVFAALDMTGGAGEISALYNIRKADGEKGEKGGDGAGDKENSDRENTEKREKKEARAEEILLDAFCWEVVDQEILIQRSGLELRQVILLLESLVREGKVAKRGLNFERISLDL